MAEEKRTFDNDVRVLLSVSQLKSNRFRSTYQQSGLQRPCISRLHCRESNLSFYICMYTHIYVHKYIPTGWLLCRNGRPTQFVFLRSVNDSPFVTPFVYRPLRCETRQKRRRSAKHRVRACVCVYNVFVPIKETGRLSVSSVLAVTYHCPNLICLSIIFDEIQ